MNRAYGSCGLMVWNFAKFRGWLAIMLNVFIFDCPNLSCYKVSRAVGSVHMDHAAGTRVDAWSLNTGLKSGATT